MKSLKKREEEVSKREEYARLQFIEIAKERIKIKSERAALSAVKKQFNLK